ncbi:rhodanese-like domain-containing protein [Varunaivibrio sulfuroxidans]|uniref:Rhodanese-related sulfurtransferase n=1 Tax=Varunaivibrio sulfuroxidans TaxID=1773489 RepID=A0A4R3J7C0_9PROT|nr:rhodanese-like domain-containing protein [Varunaivibrio sulfuroxidans]TCS61302.1 rhodanese-related sulfurtransferase [Varunaivibrio sulfuroxidans]WES31082.1 rhodanese-like domain-containing protein [Varunaivibrio sulfuroxidans]
MSFDLHSFDLHSLAPIAIAAGFFVFMRIGLPRLMAWGVPFANPQTLKDLMDGGRDVVVIDVRTPGEYSGDLGHIPGALNLGYSELSNALKENGAALAAYQDAPVFVTCRTQNRSPRAAKLLKNAGLNNVQILNGGMARWKREGLPRETR